MARVPHLEPVEHAPLQVIAARWRIGEVQNWRTITTQYGALETGRHVARTPVFGATDWPTSGVQHDHKSRQILVHGPQSVVHPTAERGGAAEQLAAVHHQHGAAMDGAVCVHALHKRNVINTAGKMWKQTADPRTTLATLFEFPLWANDATFALISTTTLGLHRNCLPVILEEIWLVVKGVNVTWPAVHKQEDHTLGSPRQLWCLRSEWIRRWDRSVPIERERLSRQKSILRQHACQCDPGERSACFPEKLAPSVSAERVAWCFWYFRHHSCLSSVDGQEVVQVVED